MIRKIKKNVMPIVMIDENTLVVFSHGDIQKLNLSSGKSEKICSLTIDQKRKALSFSRLLTRRYGINEIKGALLDNNKVFILYHRNFYLLDMNKRIINRIDNNSGANGSALYLVASKGGVIFGDYGYNPSKNEMSIYYYNAALKQIDRLFTFEKGKVNHIHNFVEDIETGRIWIFVGDFDQSAAIYYTDNFFKSVELYVSGNQQYRGCCGYSRNNILVYATDSPIETNHIYRCEGESIAEVCEINGSCIYSYCNNGHLIVSTTVENQTDEMNNKKNAFRYNLGSGIKDWYVEILDICISEKIVVEKKIRVRKDALPMMPFKYGCFRFPSKVYGKRVVTMGQAVQKYDQWLISID